MKVHHFRSWLVGVALALGAACSGANEFSDNPLAPGRALFGTVRGQVTAGAEPVVGAEIQVAAGPRTATDATGAFQLNGVPIGVHRMTLRLPAGFAIAPGDSAARTVSVSAGRATVVRWSVLTTAGATP